jgi:phosphodiesterase/alkaline phosphatase D-like protein
VHAEVSGLRPESWYWYRFRAAGNLSPVGRTRTAPPVLAALPENPHIKFFDGAHRGYVRCDVTRSRWRADFRAASSVTVPDAPVATAATFEIADGNPGVVPV